MNPRPVPASRWFLRLICILLGLVLTVMIGAAVYFKHLLGGIQYIDPATTPTLSQEELDAYFASEDPSPSAPLMDPEDVEFGNHTEGITGSDTVNILLIGQDRREGETRARSDTMILCTFNKSANTLTMTSFLRDLYVQIPGYQDNRINTAYTAGGMKLLNQTLEKNFGIHIDGNIEVDFSQFAKIVDLLGGVTMELRQDEADVINKSTSGNLSAGSQLLNGKQALAYARIRKLDADGDFSRTSRQRKLLQTLLLAYRSANLSTLFALLKEVLPMVTTDMSETQLLNLVKELFHMLSDVTIVSQHIPADGTYSYKTIRGMAVLVADMDAARQLLEETLLKSSG